MRFSPWLFVFSLVGCPRAEPVHDGVSFTWRWSGAGPEELEQFVARPAEVALIGLEGVASVESLSAEGVAVVTAWSEGQQRSLSGRAADLAVLVRVDLPEGAEGPWLRAAGVKERVVAKVAVGGCEGWAGCAEVLAEAARQVPGVEEARVSGAHFERIGLHLDPARLAAFGLDVGVVRDAIDPQVVLSTGAVPVFREPAPTISADSVGGNDGAHFFGGETDSSPPVRGGHRLSPPSSPLDERRGAASAAPMWSSRGLSNCRRAPLVLIGAREPMPQGSLEDLFRLRLGPGGVAQLRDLATAQVELDPSAPLVWLDGSRAALLSVVRQPGAPPLLSRALGEALDVAAGSCPPGIEVREIALDQPSVDLVISMDGPGTGHLLDTVGQLGAGGLVEVGVPIGGTLDQIDMGRARWTSPAPLAASLEALRATPGITVSGWRGSGTRETLWVTAPHRDLLSQVLNDLTGPFAMASCALDDGLGPRRPEVGLQLDRERLAQLGVPVSAVTLAVRAATDGLSVGHVASGGDLLPLVLQVGETSSVEALQALTLPGPGHPPLAEVADLTLDRAIPAVRRRDAQPALRLELSCPQESRAEVRELVKQILGDQAMPPGVAVELEAVTAGRIEEILERILGNL